MWNSHSSEWDPESGRDQIGINLEVHRYNSGIPIQANGTRNRALSKILTTCHSPKRVRDLTDPALTCPTGTPELSRASSVHRLPRISHFWEMPDPQPSELEPRDLDLPPHFGPFRIQRDHPRASGTLRSGVTGPVRSCYNLPVIAGSDRVRKARSSSERDRAMGPRPTLPFAELPNPTVPPPSL